MAAFLVFSGRTIHDFEVVLIGKDGGVKARTSDPGALQDFLALIDTMPMRRAEMRSRGDADTVSQRC